MRPAGRVCALAVTTLLVVASVGALITLGAGVASATNHGNCTTVTDATTIEQSGCYELGSDLTASGDPIVEIDASDVVFDGRAHELGGGDPAIHVLPGVSNVTVRNVTVYQSYDGIHVEEASDVAIRNVTTRGNYDGIWVEGSTDVTIRDVEHRYDEDRGIYAEDSTTVAVERVTTALSSGEGFEDHVVYFDYSTGSISDSVLEAGEYGLGVELYYSHGTVLDNVTVSVSEEYALDVDSSEDVVVRDSAFATGPDDDAVYVDDSPNARLRDLSIEGGEYGLVLSGSANVTMRNVAMDNSTWGFYVSGYYRHDIDQSNTVDGLPVYIYEDVDGMTFDGSVDRGYFAVVDSTDITLSGINRSGTGQGFVAAHVDGLTIGSSQFTDDSHGISVANSTDVEITDTNVTESHYGVYLSETPGTTIESITAHEHSYWSGSRQALRVFDSPDLTVSNGSFDGMTVWVVDSDRLHVSDSEFSAASVVTYGSDDTVVRTSDFADTGSAVAIKDFSRRTTIANNTFSGMHFAAISITGHSHGAVVRDNHVSGVTETSSGGDAVFLREVSDVLVRENVLRNLDGGGIALAGGSRTVVEDNAISAAGFGVGTTTGRDTDGFVVRNNRIDDVGNGVSLDDFVSDAIVEGNVITNATANGIEADDSTYWSADSTNVTITGNDVQFVGGSAVSLDNVGGYIVANNTFRNGTSSLAVRVADSAAVEVVDNDVEGHGRPAMNQNLHGAISVDGTTDVEVHSNVLESSYTGLHVTNVDASTVVRDNRVLNATHAGVWASSSAGSIRDNEVRGSQNLGVRAVGFSSAGTLFVVDNAVVESGGAGIDTGDTGVMVRNNTLRANDVGIEVSGNGGSASGNGTVVRANRITGTVNVSAIYVYRAENGVVADNVLRDNAYGIVLSSAQEFEVTNNTVENSSVGLWMGRTFSDISHRVDGGYRYSWFRETADNQITGNEFVDVDEGVHVLLVPDALLSEEEGVTFRTDTSVGTSGITVTFSVEEGDEDIITDVVNGPSVVNNTVADNAFDAELAFVETQGVDMPFLAEYDEELSPNRWNTSATPGTNVANGSTLGGNYWAAPDGAGFSQTCSDADADGFCDVSYELAGANNTDRLPLADPQGTTSSPHGPIAVRDHFITTMDEPIQVAAPGVLANDYYPDGSSVSAFLVSQPANGTVIPNSDGKIGYGPDSGFTGTDTFSYRVDTEDGESSNVATVTVEVLPDPDRPPHAADDHHTIRQGETLEAAVLENDYDPDGDDLVVSDYNGSVDDGSVFVAAVGLGYTAPADFTGTVTFSYRAQKADGSSTGLSQDGTGPYSNWATVTVDVLPDPDRPPQTADDHYTLVQGETLEAAVLENDYDPDGDELVVADYNGSAEGGSVIGVPAGFGYTPPADFTGTDTFTYRVQAADESSTSSSPWGVEGTGPHSNWATVTVEVLPDPNRAPVVVGDQYAVLEGETLEAAVVENDHDPDGDSFSVSDYNGSIEGGSLVGVPVGFGYTPPADFTGTDAFTYRVEDDGGARSNWATVSVTVIDRNSTNPVAIDDSFAVYAGEMVEIPAPGLIENDLDPANASIWISNHGSPTDGSIATTASGGFTYLPDPGFVGADSFEYRLENDQGAVSNWATVSVEVHPDPDRPSHAAADHYTILESETLEAAVLENDYDADGDELVVADYNGSAEGAAVTGVPTGFGYTPPTGFTGTDSFTYRAQKKVSTGQPPWGVEGTGPYSNWATVTVEVLPDPDRPPHAAADHYTIREGETLEAEVLENDYDADGDELVVADYNASVQGASVIGVPVGFGYTPPADFTGTDTFTYRVQKADESDTGASSWGPAGVGEPSNWATVTVEVLPDPNRAPVTAPDTFVTGVDDTLQVTVPGVLGNDYDPDGDDIAVDGYGAVQHGTAPIGPDGGLTYVPDPGYVGALSAEYVAVDTSAVATDGLVTILVVDPDRPATVAVAPESVTIGTVETGASETATVTVANVGGTPLTVSGVDVTGAETTSFGILSGNDTAVLATGETHDVTVAFSPTEAGFAAETLRIHSDDPATPTVEVPLVGTAVAGSDSGTGGAGESDDETSDSPGRSADEGGSSVRDPAPGEEAITVTRGGDGRVNVSVRNARANATVRTNTTGQSSGNVSLDGLDVTPLVDGDFTLNVSVSETPPPGAPTSAPTGDAPMAYLNVDHSIADEDIGGVTFRFRVAKTRLTDRGLAPEDVVVYRYHDGQWEAATMNVSGETADAYVFRATVPGLSVFAVSTGDRPTAAQQTATEAETDRQDTDTPTDGGSASTVTETATATVTATPAVDGPSEPRPVERSGFPASATLALLVLIGGIVALLYARR